MEEKDYISFVANRVYNQLGYNLPELVYEKCMAAELLESCKNVQTEYHIQEYYTTVSGRKIQIADLRIDILINNETIIELKTLENSLSKKKYIKKTKEYLQIERYLKITNIKKGYLINFYNGGVDIFLVLNNNFPPEIN